MWPPASRFLPFFLIACALLPRGPAAAQTGQGALPDPPPDSAELHERARDAQRRFERIRVRHLPRVWGGPSGPCDVRIGRLCQWHDPDGDWTPHPPVPEIDEAREALLEVLARVGSRHPGDGWVLGQRIQYLAEAGRWEEARRVAEGCPAEARGWWCPALMGFVLHGSTAFADAEHAFERAVEAAPEDLVDAWLHPTEILDGAVRDLLDDASGRERERLYRRFWILADPLHLVPGNDRRTAHLALKVLARIREGTRSPFGGRFRGDLAEALVRYGWEVGWERSRGRIGSLTDNGSVISQQHPRARRYVPTRVMISDPADVEPGEWIGSERAPPATYAPAYAPDLGELEAQVAVFRLGDSVVVVGAYRLPPEEQEDVGDVAGGAGEPEEQEGGTFLFAPPEREDWTGSAAGLFLLPWGEDGAPDSGVAEVRREGGSEGVLSARVPAGTYVLSLEHLDRESRRGGRHRMGLRESAYPAGVPVLSDLLLLEDGGGRPETLEEAIPRARRGVRVESGERVWVAFALHGLREREAATLRMTVEPADPGLLRRAGEWVGFLDPERPVALQWEEMAEVGPGLQLRVVELHLPELEPGRYAFRLAVGLRGRTTMVAERVVEVVP